MGTMTFESQGLYIVAIYIWLPPASYVVFLTTLVVAVMHLENLLGPVGDLYCLSNTFRMLDSSHY